MAIGPEYYWNRSLFFCLQLKICYVHVIIIIISSSSSSLALLEELIT
jgi:hypothetical protein